MFKRLLIASLFLICVHMAYAENDSIPANDSIPQISVTSTDIVLPEWPRDSFIPIGPIEPIIPIFPKDTIPSIIRPSEPEVPKVDPLKPNIPVASDSHSVGTPTGNLTINRYGAAEYSLLINCPNGGSLTPQIGIVYSSHNTSYGLAGYGISVSGFSSITRGEKNRFNNNGDIAGITYTSSDNLYLDGKRLILLSGTHCHEGAEYCLEGDPYTSIIAHGNYGTSIASTWFEVKTPDGKIYQYGNSPDSRVDYINKSGHSRIASWHVNRLDDIYGNYLTYTYSIRNYYVYPVSIAYGMNSNKDRDIINKIDFEYEPLGCAPGIFNIEDQRGIIDQRLSTITTLSNGTVYRKYNLEYQDFDKFARLDKFYEENGHGESFNPVSLWWEHLPWGDVHNRQISVPTVIDEYGVTESGKNFFAADLNNDGISDIIRISPVTVETFIENKHTFNNENRVYISCSKVSSSGDISYQYPAVFSLRGSINWDNIVSTIGGSSLADFDGDGYNDIIIAYYNQNDQTRQASFGVIKGRDVIARTGIVNGISIALKASNEIPLFVTFDADKNGKDEIVCIEQSAINGFYPANIISLKDNMTPDAKDLSLNFPAKPEKLFCGDYNNDGLTDIIALYNGGYKIYFNNGGSDDTDKFTESNSKTGTEIGNHWRYQQGDFDGDGLMDFVYNVSKESCLWIARNNGDGTFSCVQSDDIGIADKTTLKDNHRYSMVVCDINQDGKSDVMICKAEYRGASSIYDATQVRWLFSDGSTLKLKRQQTKKRLEDTEENYIFSGDFNGDGYIEIANYGSKLTATDDTFTENQLNIYSDATNSSIGRITRIIDGMGNNTYIDYSYATNPQVYTNTSTGPNQYSPSTYPVNTYSLPLPLVSRVSIYNGVAGVQQTEYSYKDFKVHMQGAGPLGFQEVTRTNTTNGESTTTTITKWDEIKWIPTETKVVNTIGERSSITISSNTIANVRGTYFSYESNSQITDIDGNKAITVTRYDTDKGVILEQKTLNGGNNMYKQVVYSGYQNKSGKWLPTGMTLTQKHEHDVRTYTTETQYTYDEKGNLTTSTSNYGTPLALTTTATYDTFGNRLSSTSTGAGITPITKYNDFDQSGRFVIKSYYYPEAAINTYTYDVWGNLLTENDITDPLNVLTTSNTYDNWGRVISTKAPDGTKTTKQIGWGKSKDKKYYILTQKSESPWIMTWFDEIGHEVLQESFGPMNVLRSKTTTYNDKGLISKIESIDGLLSISETLVYDELGRLQQDIHSSGKAISLSYGNRTVITETAGRISKKISDAWGNILQSIDPDGGEVTYRYNSNGKPSSITTNGSTVTMEYDYAGNLIKSNDPDAGNTTYAYAADGKILQTTNAKGEQTENIYDSLGRLKGVHIGETIIENTYGTAGNEKLRLVKSQIEGDYVEYTHDRLGRIVSEERNIAGTAYKFIYDYDNRNRLAKTIYPGGLEVIYKYDDYGFNIETIADGKSVYKLKKYTGLESTTSFVDSLTVKYTCDKNGYIISRKITNNKILHDFEIIQPFGLGNHFDLSKENVTLDRINMQYDPMTGNLLSRERMGHEGETFEYDHLDRLISVRIKDNSTMEIDYASNGNIVSKTGIGEYNYISGFKPHAVVSVDNDSGTIPTDGLTTSFNNFGKIRLIEDEGSGYSMDFSYGPDLQRWNTKLWKDGKVTRNTIYVKNCDIIEGNNIARIFYYLNGNTIVVKENDEFKPYLAFTDNLGSILSVFDKESTKVFDATYDAWGKQDVTLNTIGLIRGYTGHEMLNEFGIINMNGRLYDPVLGRFFSPDPYVQLSDFTQSYNRYSYCLNNPLKYTDPTGELFGIDDAIFAFALFNLTGSMMQAAFNGDNIWKAGAISLLSSAASFGIGQMFGAAGAIGKEVLRAGAHGISGGVFSVLDGGDFGSGIAAGVISSGLGSFVNSSGMSSGLTVLSSTVAGGVAAWATGGDFMEGALMGLKIGLFNHILHNMPVRARYQMDPNGVIQGELNEVVFTAYRPMSGTDQEYAMLGTVTTFMTINDGVYSFGKSLEDNSYNSTLGNNGQLYLHSKGERGFYGNQYVRTIRLSKIGNNITKVTGHVGTGLGVVQIAAAGYEDYQCYKYNGHTDWYHTARASASFAGACIGTKYGLLIGTACGGIGVVPAVAIGAACGFIGGYVISFLSEKSVDFIYGRSKHE